LFRPAASDHPGRVGVGWIAQSENHGALGDPWWLEDEGGVTNLGIQAPTHKGVLVTGDDTAISGAPGG